MNITEISVKRPAAIMMVVILLIGLGVIGYKSMGADLLPSMDVPVITISTTYSGASADDIKKDVVKPIEDAVSGISGIDTIRSTSQDSNGNVIIQFKMGKDMNSAFTDVQKAVDAASGSLPKAADKPIIYKFDMNQQAVITLNLSGKLSQEELYNEADKIKQSLQKIQGVGQVEILGANKKQLMIKLDKTAMEYYGVSTTTLMGTLQGYNISMPSGSIKHEKSEESVRVVGEFENINQVKNLLIPTVNGGKIRLDSIASVVLEEPEETSIVKLNGKKTVALQIQKQSDANVVTTVDSIKAEVQELKKTVPSTINMELTDDTTVFIHSALSQIEENLVEGIITTAIVLFFFLRSWKSSLIVLIAIPTSLIATFFMMYELKFTLNMMTLMGLSLCIGTLVDDSIVVLENIQRHLAMGKNPVAAAIEGRKEIGMAAIAITLCDVVVYLPIALTGGITGMMFKQFGITIVVATLFSLFISFTVTPMLASRIYKQNEDEEKVSSGSKKNIFMKVLDKFSESIDGATESYRKFLIWSLDNRKKVLAVVVALFVFSIALIPMGFIGKEFMSNTDQGEFGISLTLAPNVSLKQTDAKVAQIEKYLSSLQEIKYYSTTVGSRNDKTSAQIIVELVSKSKRKKSQSDMAGEVRNWCNKNLAGADCVVSESQMGGSSKPISINVEGDNEKTLKDLSDKIASVVKSVHGAVDVSSSLNDGSSELRIKVDRLAASQYGLSISDIASVLRAGISGTQTGTYRGNDGEYDIMLKFMDGQINNSEDVLNMKILNSSGQQISLNQVASIVRDISPKKISRENRQDIVTISANIQGRTLGDVNNDINTKLKAINIPSGYNISFGGNQKQMADTFASLGKAIAASIALIYMILVVLYESFLTPFIRLLSLPCAIIGALGMLAITGKSLNMMSLLGLIMLDGLASKNGTLLIDYTNTLMKNGVNLREALIDSGTTRLRPIIMTSVTMVVGMLPAALSIGEGSEFKSDMAVVIIGGMVASTILSPIVLPVVYTLMDDIKNKISKRHDKIKSVSEVE